MKKLFVLFAALAGLVTLAGCGHNTAVYGKGLGFETTLNPQTFTFGLNLRYGDILTVCMKEKSELIYSNETTADGNVSSEENKTGKSGTVTKSSVTFKTGDQITGYAVELEKAKAGKAAETEVK